MPDTNNPIDADVASAVQASNVAPTETTVGNFNPQPTPQAQPVGQTQPTLPQPSQAQPTQPAPNAAQPNPQQAQQPQPQPPSLRSRIFDTILKAGAGTPVQGPDGKPIPMTRGIMGKAIIANALAGMMAGYGTSETVNTKNGPVRVNNPGKAVAAGFQAGEKLQGQRQQAVDDAQARAYNTVKRNVDLVQQQLAVSSAYMHNSEAYGKSLDDQAANAAPALKDWQAYDEGRDQTQPAAIVASHLTYEDAMKKFNIAKTNAIPDGKVAVRNPQIGQMEWHQTYTILNSDAKPAVSQESLRMLAKYGIPGYAKLAENPNGVAAGIVPVGQVVGAMNQANTLAHAENYLNHAASEIYKSEGGSGEASLDLVTAVKNNRQLIPAIMNAQKALASGQPTYKVMDAIRNTPGSDKLVDLLGGGDAVNKYITDKTDEATAAAETAKKTADADAQVAKDKATGAYEERQLTIANKTLENKKLTQELSNPATLGITDDGNVVDGKNPDYIRQLPENTRSLVTMIGEGRAPVSARMFQSKDGKQLAEVLARAYPGFDSTRAEAYQKVRNSFTSGKDSQSIQALNVALAHASNMYNHVSAVATVPGISNIARMVGNKDAAAVNTDRAAVSSELAKAYASGAFTQGEKDEWEKKLSASSPLELKANLQEFATLLNGKFDALSNAWQNGVPVGFVRPIKIVGPQAAAAYKNLTGLNVPDEYTRGGAQQQAQTQAQTPNQPQFSQWSSDGKWGWNGSQWVATGTGK